jgi:hypothetical protein
MSRRYLVGPVTATFVGERLLRARPAGACLAFSRAGNRDLTGAPADPRRTSAAARAPA